MKMTSEMLFVTGMVRSGTTVISRAVDAHPEIVCALDPCMGVFKAFNNALLRGVHGRDVPVDAPLTDFFFESWPTIDVYGVADLDIELRENLSEIRRKIGDYAEANSPAILQKLGAVHGETYAEVLGSLLEVIRSTYGRGTPRCVGFKQTWVEALVPAVVNSFETVRCVHVIRDPRAVIASWKKAKYLSHDYPFLMMIRHWRKSVALARRWSRRYSDYAIVKYEEFALEPEREMRRIAEMCDVDYHPQMLDSSRYRDGAGEPWSSNTSYRSEDGDVTDDFVNRWRQRLSSDETGLIEELCTPEMAWLGLERDTEEGQLERLMQPVSFERNSNEEDEWVDALREQYALGPRNRAEEMVRWLLMRHGQEYLDRVPLSKLESIVLDRSFLVSE